MAQIIKHLPTIRETQVQSLGWEDPLEKEMATHSSILAWRIPWTEEPGGLQSVGVPESDTTKHLTLITLISLSTTPRVFPDISIGKESACNEGDPGSIPGLGRCPGEGKGYPLQYSGLENSIDCIVHGVRKSRT